MNRSKFALFVALIIHILLMLVFWILGSIVPQVQKEEAPKENKIRVSLKELPPVVKKLPPTKQIIKTPPIAPEVIKGSQLKKIIKREPVKYIPKVKVKPPILNKKIQPKKKKVNKAQTKRKKIKTKPIPTKEVFIPIKKERKKAIVKEVKKTSPMSWLYDDKAKHEVVKPRKELSSTTSSGKNIRELYGSKFGELSLAQQEYILDNQEVMRRITQAVLTRQASVSDLRGLHVNKTNVIEFYLHPNGDKTDFRFLSKSGYFILDEITRVTIEYAYSKYPRPKEKTLIRYNVFYNLR